MASIATDLLLFDCESMFIDDGILHMSFCSSVNDVHFEAIQIMLGGDPSVLKLEHRHTFTIL